MFLEMDVTLVIDSDHPDREVVQDAAIAAIAGESLRVWSPELTTIGVIDSARIGEAKLWLTGRDRVLAEKLAKELQQSAKHPTRGPYEIRRGSTFDVQGTLDDEPTGRIYKVTIELTEVEQV